METKLNPKTNSSHWKSLRFVSKQLNRKGVGRSNLILILKQEGIINQDKRPKPALIQSGLCRIKLYNIRLRSGENLQLSAVQFSEKGTLYLQKILAKRDLRIERCLKDIQKIETTRKIFIRSKIKAI